MEEDRDFTRSYRKLLETYLLPREVSAGMLAEILRQVHAAQRGSLNDPKRSPQS